MYASYEHHSKIIELLLREGAEINARAQQNSPLENAVMDRDEERDRTVEILLKAASNLDSMSKAIKILKGKKSTDNLKLVDIINSKIKDYKEKPYESSDEDFYSCGLSEFKKVCETKFPGRIENYRKKATPWWFFAAHKEKEGFSLSLVKLAEEISSILLEATEKSKHLEILKEVNKACSKYQTFRRAALKLKKKYQPLEGGTILFSDNQLSEAMILCEIFSREKNKNIEATISALALKSIKSFANDFINKGEDIQAKIDTLKHFLTIYPPNCPDRETIEKIANALKTHGFM